MVPKQTNYQPTRRELEFAAEDYRRAAQHHARFKRFETCEAYLDLYAGARIAIDRLDAGFAAEIDLDIPISVEELDAALFAQVAPETLRSHM